MIMTGKPLKHGNALLSLPLLGYLSDFNEILLQMTLEYIHIFVTTLTNRPTRTTPQKNPKMVEFKCCK